MKTVVWVDDDPLLSRPFQQELELLSVDLIFLKSCTEYLKFIDSARTAELFIIDLVMKPEGRVSNIASNYGLETGVVLTIETRRVHPDAPVLLFTNTANASAREEAKRKLAGVKNVTFVPKSRMTQTGKFGELVTALIERSEKSILPAEGAPDVHAVDVSDVFISYASEDRDSIAKPLALELRDRGLRVWFDDFEFSAGDGLSKSIDKGLSSCRFGVVILSEAFFSKGWTQRELGGLTAREVLGKKLILPIWHGISRQRVLQFSPMLSDKIAIDSSKLTLFEIADEIERAIGKSSGAI